MRWLLVFRSRILMCDAAGIKLWCATMVVHSFLCGMVTGCMVSHRYFIVMVWWIYSFHFSVEFDFMYCASYTIAMQWCFCYCCVLVVFLLSFM